MKKYDLEITFTEPLLASSPSDPAVYKQFIEAKAREERPDESETLPSEKREELGWSVFHKDETGLFLFDYHVRGFLKEAATAVTAKGEIPAIKSKIDRWVFVTPRRLYFHSGNSDRAILQAPDGVEERPLRAMTMQGPRVSLKRSDYLNSGTWFACQLTVLDLAENIITESFIRNWLDYGQWAGFGEWRNASFGRYAYALAASPTEGARHSKAKHSTSKVR